MLSCRLRDQPDVLIRVGVGHDDFLGSIFIGAPYVSTELLRYTTLDSAGRRYHHELPYHWGMRTARGLGTLLRLVINDVNDARSEAA